MGRRAFLKRTGAATAATAIALNGFKTEVVASTSCLMIQRIIKERLYLNNTTGNQGMIVGSGSSNTPWGAHLSAIFALKQAAKNSGYKNLQIDPNPTLLYAPICAEAPMIEVTVSILPQNAGIQPVIIDGPGGPGQPAFLESIEFPVYANGQTVIVISYKYGHI